MENQVSKPIAAYDTHQALCKLPRALMGGTTAMRQAGKIFLPQEPKETKTSYSNRLNRTTLFNGFRRTVQLLTGQVFRKTVVLGDDVSENIKVYAEDIDQAGNHLNIFAMRLFTSGIRDGVSHVLVDMPAIPKNEDGTPKNPSAISKADEIKMGRRPYFIHVPAGNLIGWQLGIVNGRITLLQVRIKERIEEQDGEYGVREAEQIRVLRPGHFEVWRKQTDSTKKETWLVVESGNTSLSSIPLVTFMPGDRITHMTARPALEDLADLNLAHWQSESDQRNILHVARVPVLFGKMLGDSPAAVEISAHKLVSANDAGADLKFVEHSGAAIDSGRQDLQDLESKMALYGLQLLTQRTGSMTATERALDSSESDTTVQSWAALLQDTLEGALGYMAQYMGSGDDKGGSVTVNKEFRLDLSGENAKMLIDAVREGILSRQIVFDEFRRRGLVHEDSDWTDIQAQMENENRSGPGKLSVLAANLQP